MKRRFIPVLLFTMFIMLVSGCTKEIPDSQKKDCTLYLDIAFESNIFLDRNDVNIYIDETKAGSADHGEDFSALLTVKEGKHTLLIYRRDDHDVRTSKSFTLKDNSTIQCSIKTHSRSIELNDYTFTESIEGVLIAMPDVKGMRLTEAIRTLQDLGFQNISYESSDGSSVFDENNWVVTKKNQLTGEEIDKKAKILLTVTKLSDYLTSKLKGLPADRAADQAKALGYQVIYYKNVNGTEDMTSEVEKLSAEEIKVCIVDHAEDVSNDIGRKICLYVRYNKPVPEASFSSESAKRAAVTALTNYFAMDVFDSTGNEVDPSKIHSYADTSGNTDDYYLHILSAGKWSVKDTEIRHCEGLTLKNSWGTEFKFNLDVSFDGSVYTISNVIDAKGTNASNTQVYPDSDPSYTVTPEMIAEDRTDGPAAYADIPTDGNINSFIQYLQDILSSMSPDIQLIESTIYVNIYYDGMEALAASAKENGGEDLETWNNITNRSKELSAALRKEMYTANVSDYHIAVSLMNDVNHENVLYTALDGETFADYPNE